MVVQTEDEVMQRRQGLAELDHEISGGQQRATELRGQVEREENRIQFHEERLRELDQQNARALGDIAQGEERRTAAEEEFRALIERLAGAEAAVQDWRRQLEERRGGVQAVEGQLVERQQALRTAQSEAFGAAQQLSRVRNELTALDLQKQAQAVRMEKLGAEKIQLEEERGRLEGRLVEFVASVEAEREAVQVQRGTVEQRQVRLKELHLALQAAGQELDGLTRRQAGLRSELSVLEQLEASHEGFSSGALAALKAGQPVLGTLADRLRVPDGAHIPAVEAVLGHHLQLVLASDDGVARAVLADLTAGKKGRASLATLESPQGWEALVGEVGESGAVMEGVSGGIRLVEVIEADESVRSLVHRLVGRTWLVSDLAAATEAWRVTGGRWDFVTPTGDLLSGQGVFTGGAGNGKGGVAASILARKNQIAGLREQVEVVGVAVAEASRRRGALQAEQTEVQAGLQQAQTDLRVKEVAVATHEGECNALRQSQRVVQQRMEAAGFEWESLAGQEREAALRREDLTGRLTRAEAVEQAAQERATLLTGEIEGLRQRRDEVQGALTEAKVGLAAEEQVWQGLQRQQDPLRRRIEELTALVEARRRECQGFLERRAQSETEAVAARSAIERWQHEREVLNAQLAELGGRRVEQEAGIAEREGVLKDERARWQQWQARRSQLEVELAQRRMAVENLEKRIEERYQVRLADVRSECITVTVAEDGPPRVHVMTPEEMAATGAGTDWDAVAGQVGALQRRVDEIGPVNLVAIEEYEEAEQRHAFLSAQHDDLVQAKAQLVEVITRINEETRTLFAVTFEQIRENFRLLFAEIFGGGQADLQLSDASDVLESGIDIMARPPGKQLRSISLLSGGEQTMTAVALLFAIYQVKPSPFAVLDELDAPLDESNINRFIRILQRFLERSQFVIITHNKRTIGMADVLYGVTMQEQGVSRLVSVKFHKAEEPAGSMAPLVPPAAGGPDVEVEEEKEQSREDTLEVVMAK
jgi:chromosome segregation protein